jgi:HK97 family phage portal protein
MGLFDWLRGPTREQMDAEYRATLANPTVTVLDAFGGSPSYSGERVDVKRMFEEAGVYSAVRMISDAVGMCPMKVYRVSDDDARLEARGHRSYRMLHDAPNELCSATDFWSTVAVHLLAYENALIGKERGVEDQFGVSFVEQLYLLDPSAYELEIVNGRKRFTHRESGRRFGQEDILHISGFSMGGYVGQSRAELCRQSLGTAIARSKFEGAFYRQGGRIPGVIEYPGRLGKEGTKNLAASMAMTHGGVDNMHKTPVLEEGATYKAVGQSMESMQFAELRQQTMTEIAVMFQMPPSYLGASTGDSLTYATTESNQIQFAQMAVAPLANRIQKAVSNDPEILPWNVMFAEFRLEALYRADMKTRAEYWEKMLAMGVVDVDYVAARENLPKPPPPKPEPAPPALGDESLLPARNGNLANSRIPV